MKKMSLNKTWSECLRMWKWIVSRVRKNSFSDLFELKELWLEKNGYMTHGEEIYNDCFFCEYAVSHNGEGNGVIDICGYCSKCPGVLVDKTFACESWEINTNNCDWRENPIGFYKRLVELNKKRLSKKGKKNVKVSK